MRPTERVRASKACLLQANQLTRKPRCQVARRSQLKTLRNPREDRRPIASRPGALIGRVFQKPTCRWVCALAAVCFLQTMPGGWAQQLQFANPLPSTQLLYSKVGVILVVVLNPDATIATNSSAQITLTLVGPANYSN